MAQPLQQTSPPPCLEEVLWQDACLAIDMIALMIADGIAKNPPSLRIKANAGPVREAVMQRLEEYVPKTSFKKMPLGIDEQRLIGGLDLSATLNSGVRVASKGLLAQCHDQMMVVPMANLLPVETVSQLTAAMDLGFVNVERDGLSARDDARFGIVVFDETDDGDTPLSSSLCDRIMFHLDLSSLSYRALSFNDRQRSQTISPKALCHNNIIEDVCSLALSFGLTSIRPVKQAISIAVLHARLNGRTSVIQDDVMVAVRLSLLQRASQIPQPPPKEEEQQPQTESPQTDSDNKSDDEQTDQPGPEKEDQVPDGALDDISIEALAADLPEGLLDQLAAQISRQSGQMSQGRKGKRQYSNKRGRPMASRRGALRSGHTLDIMATLRAAAPWQKIRKLENTTDSKLHIRPSDFHIRRFKQNTETSTIFVVDASGSTALNRLGEAKGAIESLLSEGYARRDHVALVSFRKREAEVLLSPTRSLVRAKKSLSSLPGGGGTPLASGLEAAYLIALEELRQGRMVSIVLLTDGSANVSLDGSGGRVKAMDDALKIGNVIAGSNIPCLVVDVSRIPNPKAKKLAENLSGDYVQMPFVSSKNLSDAVKASR